MSDLKPTNILPIDFSPDPEEEVPRIMALSVNRVSQIPVKNCAINDFIFDPKSKEIFPFSIYVNSSQVSALLEVLHRDFNENMLLALNYADSDQTIQNKLLYLHKNKGLSVHNYANQSIISPFWTQGHIKMIGKVTRYDHYKYQFDILTSNVPLEFMFDPQEAKISLNVDNNEKAIEKTFIETRNYLSRIINSNIALIRGKIKE